MWGGLLTFFIAAILGFLYGKKVHLKQMATILLRTGSVKAEEIDKLIDLVSSFKKLERAAKKKTKEEYQQLVVKQAVEKIKKKEE